MEKKRRFLKALLKIESVNFVEYNDYYDTMCVVCNDNYIARLKVLKLCEKYGVAIVSTEEDNDVVYITLKSK